MGKDGSVLQERRNIAFLSIYVLSMKVYIFSTTFSELMATDTVWSSKRWMLCYGTHRLKPFGAGSGRDQCQGPLSAMISERMLISICHRHCLVVDTFL